MAGYKDGSSPRAVGSGRQQQAYGINSENAGAMLADQTEIVTGWAKEFKLEGL